MADAPLRESVAPFREAVSAFAEAAAFVRRYGDDAAYRESLRALQALPFASTFHPFAVTAQWVIEQATGVEQSRVSRAAQSVGSQTPARSVQRQRLALVNRSPSSEPIALRASGDPSKRATDSLASRQQAKPKEPDAEASIAQNSWSVLVHVSKLLEELQPSGSGDTGIGRALAGAASPDADAARHAGSSPLAQLGQRLGEAAASQVNRSKQNSSAVASRIEHRENRGATDGGQESSLSLLGHAVATLWQTQKEAPTSSHRQATEATHPSGPAPRVPSMLVPSAIAGALPKTDAGRGVAPGEQDPERPDSAAPSPAHHDEELVVDRVNRALIEQAWLRGVDLA